MYVSVRTLGACLIVYYGILPAHTFDAHFRSPAEEREMERDRQEKQDEEDREIFNDEERDEQERRDALGRLAESEGMV